MCSRVGALDKDCASSHLLKLLRNLVSTLTWKVIVLIDGLCVRGELLLTKPEQGFSELFLVVSETVHSVIYGVVRHAAAGGGHPQMSGLQETSRQGSGY